MPYVVHWKDGTSSEMTDKQFENMPHEMEGEIGKVQESQPAPAAQPKSAGYPGYKSPQQAKDLYSRVQTAGYSLLTPEEQDLFNKQYSYSQAARRGMSLAEVQAYADKNKVEAPAPNPWEVAKQLPSNIYQGTRDVLAKTVGGPLSSLTSGLDEYTGVPDSTSPTGIRSVPRIPGSNYFERVAADQPGEIERGQAGQGLPGMLSDPMNLAMAVPVAGEARIASVLGKVPLVGERAAALSLKYPLATAGIASGLTNAGLAAGSAAIDPLNPLGLRGSAGDVAQAGISPLRAAAIGGALGLGAGVIGKGLTQSAIENYPGAQKLENMMLGGTKNTQMVDLTRPERIRAYELATGRSTIPTRRDFFDAANDVRAGTAGDFDRAASVFDEYAQGGYPHGYVHTDDLGQVMRDQILQEAAPGGTLSTAVTEGDIENYLAPIIEANTLTAKLGRAPLSTELPRLAKSRDMAARLEELRPGWTAKWEAKIKKMSEADKHLPISELKRTLGTLNEGIGGMLSKKPSAESKMALAAHEGIVNDILSSGGKNVASLPLSAQAAGRLSNAELAAALRARYGKLTPQAEREIKALERLQTPLAELPTENGVRLAAFNDFLAPNTRADYGFGSKMLKAVNRQADAGASMRVGMPLEFLPHFYTKVGSTYGLQGAKYKLGKFLAENPLLASKLAQGVAATDFALSARKAAKDTTGRRH